MEMKAYEMITSCKTTLKVGDVLNDYINLMQELNIPEKLQSAVLYDTAADILRSAGVEL